MSAYACNRRKSHPRLRFVLGGVAVSLLASLWLAGRSLAKESTASQATLATGTSAATKEPSKSAKRRPRARDLGIPFEGTPGRYNAITDVPGVEVGHTTLIRGEGRSNGQSASSVVRTGVTAIFPHSKTDPVPCVAAMVSLNGNGELTGSHWVNESGFLETPIVLTNTHSVGVVRDAVVAWGNQKFTGRGFLEEPYSLAVVGETYDGFLNDIAGQHVKPEHVFAALDGAKSGPVAEGSVGGGTGMVTSEFKGGIGTSSRVVAYPGGGGKVQGKWTVGVLVQANYGRRVDLRILGVPVGREIFDRMPLGPKVPGGPATQEGRSKAGGREKDGSIIVVVATDAPLLPQQMARLARRPALGMGRLGAVSYQSSGDLFIAFGVPQPDPDARGLLHFTALPNDQLDPLLQAVVQATEEAIVNALVAADTMTGIDGRTVYGLPHDRLLQVLRKYRVVK
ncbi:MAG: P1 family peptidase [Myxococcales bacterium]|nr:P1 family peptidase [Myxococcales bacterium]